MIPEELPPPNQMFQEPHQAKHKIDFKDEKNEFLKLLPRQLLHKEILNRLDEGERGGLAALARANKNWYKEVMVVRANDRNKQHGDYHGGLGVEEANEYMQNVFYAEGRKQKPWQDRMDVACCYGYGMPIYFLVAIVAIAVIALMATNIIPVGWY